MGLLILAIVVSVLTDILKGKRRSARLLLSILDLLGGGRKR
ncbi:MAG: hypothetical protein ACOYEP_09380 [Limnochordia bacterium]